jgi:predicted dehydrogenase
MSADGMNYAPQGKPQPVVKEGEFVFASAHLDHGHIYGQTNGLLEAGATLKWVYDPDPEKVAKFVKVYPQAKAAGSLEQILEDPEVKLVAAAAIPDQRGPIGCKVLRAGKDYFTDKTPFTTMEQLEEARRTVKETGQKYMVYYSERLHVESAMFAGELIDQGVIGKVVQVTGFGPHRIGDPAGRPGWFWEKKHYGGILCDIGSHQCEQFLHYTGAKSAKVTFARVANTNTPDYPELEDLGEANIVGDNGSSFYYRVDWLNPKGLRTWGDGRTFIIGTKGYIELRKYINLATDDGGDLLYLVTDEGEKRFECKGKVGYKYFGQLILDCINRTENAMTQEHAFLAAQLCLECQELADKTRV